MKELKFGTVTGGAGKPSTSSYSAEMGQASRVTSIAKEERATDINLLEIGKRYNANMLVAGRTPEYLYKGMKEGKPIEELFMIAVKGVAACVNDPMLVKVMERGLEERRSKE